MFPEKTGKGRIHKPKKSFKYFSNLSIHGINHIVEESPSLYKTTFWSIAWLICAFLCNHLVYERIIEFKNNRVVTAIGTTAYPIWKVPFPAVTVCNFNVVHKSNIEPIVDYLNKKNFPPSLINDFFMNLSSTIVYSDGDLNFNVYKDIIHALREGGYDTNSLMAKVAQPCNKLVKRCIWLNEETECEEIFHVVKTSKGYCCSFNSALGDSNESKYNQRFVLGIGSKFGLEIHVDSDNNDYMSALEPHYGIHVMIHDSHEYPNSEYLATTAVLPQNDVTLDIVPIVALGNEAIRSLDPGIRECIFWNEKKLNWSQVYTYITCMTECEAELFIQYCGCLPFYYESKGNAEYCTLLDFDCLRKYNEITVISEDARNALPTNYKKQVNKQIAHDGIHTCDCEQQCTEITYTYHVDDKISIAVAGFENVSNISKIHVQYSDTTCMMLMKELGSTWDGLLASLGGVFGLCLGGSILSLVEIIYYTLQAIFDKLCSIKRKPNNTRNTIHTITSDRLYPNEFGYSYGVMKNQRIYFLVK